MALALRLVRAASLVCAVLVAASATAAPAKPQGMSLIRDAEIEDTIRAYAAPLFDAAGLGAEAVRVHIVDDRRLNAFVAGGLNLFITSGMLAAAEEPGEIAGVIAHEIGHIAGGHLVRTRGAMEDAAAETILGTLLGSGAILAGEGEAGSALIMGAWTMARQNLLRYSQVQEQAADQAAIRLLESTGQSAEGLLAMFRRLESQEFLTVERQDPYLRTHPLTRDRIRFVRNQVETRAAAGAPPPEAEAHAAAHRRMVAKLRGFLDPPKKTLRAYPESDVSVAARYARAIALYRIPAIDRALAVLDGLLADFPDDPWFHELEGQILFENGRIVPPSSLTNARWRSGAIPPCCASASPARRSKQAIPPWRRTPSAISRRRRGWRKGDPPTGTSSASRAAGPGTARVPPWPWPRPPICAAVWPRRATTLAPPPRPCPREAPAGSGPKTSPAPPAPPTGRGGNPLPPVCDASAGQAAQAGGVEAIQTALLGPVARQGAQIAGRGDGFGEARQFRRVQGKTGEIGGRREESIHGARAFLRLQRAAGVEQQPARRHHGARACEQPALEGGKTDHVGGTAKMGDVRMAPDRPGRRAGRVQQHDVGERCGAPVEGVGLHDLGPEAETGEVFPQADETARRAVDGGHARAGRQQLGGLAAGRGADLDHPPAREGTQQAHRQRRRRVLDPPSRRVVAGQRGHGAGACEPERPARQKRRVEPSGPGRRVRNDGEIERRLPQMSFRHGAAGRGAVSLLPAPPEPAGRVQAGRIQSRDGVDFAGGAAEDGVDEAAAGREARPLGQGHDARHRRMRRRAEEGALADPEPQQVLRRAPAGRWRTAQEAGEEGVDLPEAAQGREEKQAGVGGVARIQPGEGRRGGERLVQGAAAAEDGAQGGGGRAARGVAFQEPTSPPWRSASASSPSWN